MTLALLPTGSPKTASGVGAAFKLPRGTTALRVLLDVDAASGTSPTLDVVVQDTVDGGDNWATIGTFTQKNAAGQQTINIVKSGSAGTPVMFSDRVRISYTIGGTTPSFTFHVSAYAEVAAFRP
jgi:hypothetical protein